VWGQSSLDCNCGNRKESPFVTRVVGGVEAEINEFPWAALLSIKKGLTIQRCGGTLINDRFVLTAAHCVDKTDGIEVDIILGEHDTKDGSESKALRLKAVPPFVVHDKFKFSKSRSAGHVWYDFTLLELSSPVDFTQYPHIRPICLPSTSGSAGDIVTVAGWGNTEVDPLTIGDLVKGRGHSTSNTLQKIDLGLISRQECENIFRSLQVEIRDVNLCAVSGAGDSCGGDSGGGMIRKTSPDDDGYYEIVGVVSFGIGCFSTLNGGEAQQQIPGVYARVTSVLDWIEKKTARGRICKPPGKPPSGWGPWSPFSNCSKLVNTCGVGKKTRDRFCQGNNCRRTQQTQERICNYKKC